MNYLVLWEVPEELNNEILRFVNWYNNQRYHETIGNVTSLDVYLAVVMRYLKSAELKNKTLLEHKEYNSRIVKTVAESVS